MLIDWFTVIAQVVNFLILVWLLKRFLYRPILNAIDAREKVIAGQLAEAEANKLEASKERVEFQHKNEAFDQQSAALLSKATEAAKVEHQRLMDKAKRAADDLSTSRHDALRAEIQNLGQTIHNQTQEEVFAITRKVLMDLATTGLEERMGAVLIRRLHEMDNQSKADVAEALKSASTPALVRSAFDLPEAQQAAIKTALNETFAADIPVRFETAPNLVCGIELTTMGQKVAWSIADYLSEMERRVGELVEEQKQPAAMTGQNASEN